MIIHRALYALVAAMAVITSAILSGCATGESVRRGGNPADCILNRGVDDFDALDGSNLIIYGTGGRPYHVVLSTPSIGLEGEFAIGIYDDDGSICPFGGDRIIVDGIIQEVIPIRSIEELDKEALEALKLEYGQIEAAGDAVSVTEVE